MVTDDESLLALPPPPASCRLAYGDAPEQFGDLFLPRGAGPHPLAIALHGGFWRSRYDLAHLGHLCAALADAGVAVWSLEYRRVGQEGGGYPGTLHDVAQGAAAAATLSHLPVDLSRPAVTFGHSAGGQLALWLAWRQPLPLRAVVALAAVSDLAAASTLRLGAGAVAAFLGGTGTAAAEALAAASPRAHLPLRVKQLLIHGEGDPEVPCAMSSAYRQAALAAGDPVRLIALPATGHYALIDPHTPQGQLVVKEIAALAKQV